MRTLILFIEVARQYRNLQGKESQDEPGIGNVEGTAQHSRLYQPASGARSAGRHCGFQNEQPWEFVVVTDKAMLSRLPELTGHAQFIASAAACILVVCQPTVHFVEDGSAASEHILLAAHAHGLGACWVAGEKEGYADSIRAMVGAPEGYKLLCLIPVGYARGFALGKILTISPSLRSA
jgi:nitroreductase